MRKKLRKLRGKLVLIAWIDSNYTEGWSSDTPVNTPTKCHSVGRLVRVGRKAITVASHVTREPSPQRCGVMTIPRKAVTKVTALKTI